MEGQANGNFNELEPRMDDSAQLSQTLEQLSLSSTLPGPHAQHAASPSVVPKQNAGILNGPKSPIAMRRTSSSTAQTGALSSPKLQRKSSASSMRNVSNPSSPRVPTPRTTSGSFQPNSPSTLPLQPVLGPQKEEPPPVTAASIALETFTKELESHRDGIHAPETVVILHDACYGHRFSRPRTTKGSLSMIVERPERVRAAALGVSAAYVRLAARHSGGANAPRPEQKVNDRFPFHIRKSSRALSVLSPVVAAIHGKDWMSELKIMCDAAGTKLAHDGKELVRPEQRNWDDTIVEKPKFHEGDLYLCSESLDAFQGALGGVCDAVDTVFASPDGPRRAFVAVRPPGHHCSADFPSGFCWLNNVHVGIEYAAQTHGLTHAAILDFDLHHGDGSQDITWTRNEQSTQMPKNMPFNKKISIGYYSMHDINSYPCELGDKEKVQNASLCVDNAHGQSIWNVHLQPWKTEAEFWSLYEHQYLILLEKARSFLRQHTARIRSTPKSIPAKAAIFISAGFDASEWEGAGMQRHAVNVPTEFYARFTRDVVRLAQENDLATDGRVISVLEGGYSDRALASGVMSHISGLCHSLTEQEKPDAETNDGQSSMDLMSQQMADTTLSQKQGLPDYDADWWQSNKLAALEAYVGPPIPAPIRKPRGGLVPTYSTPTKSFSNKVVDAERFQRSMSGTWRPIVEAPMVQEVPEVNWIVATHELSKLLIPSERQTLSCRPEDLAAPRVKKEINTTTAVPTEPTNGGRQLRGRKAKISDYVGPASDDDLLSKRSASSQARRRQTIGDVPLSDPVAIEAVPASKRSSRRSSTASSFESAALTSTIPPVPAIPDASKYPVVRNATIPAPQLPKVRKPRPHVTKAPVKVTAQTSQPVRKATPTSAPTNPETPEYHTDGSSSATRGSSQELNELTSAVKRITLKVGSREEHDRRQKEREEAEKKAKADNRKRIRKIPSAIQGASPTVASHQSPLILPQMDGPTQSVPAGNKPPVANDAVLDVGATLAAPTPAFTAINPTAEPPQPAVSLPSVIHSPPPVAAHEEVEGVAAKLPTDASPSTNAAPVTAPAPSHVTHTLFSMDSASQSNVPSQVGRFRSYAPAGPSPVQGQTSRLPVWSSTGTIPFGAVVPPSRHTVPSPPIRDHDEGSTRGAEQQRLDDIWAIPETPKK